MKKSISSFALGFSFAFLIIPLVMGLFPKFTFGHYYESEQRLKQIDGEVFGKTVKLDGVYYDVGGVGTNYIQLDIATPDENIQVCWQGNREWVTRIPRAKIQLEIAPITTRTNFR